MIMSENTEVSQVHSSGDISNLNHLENIHRDLLFEGNVLVSGKEKQLKLMQNGIILEDQATNTSSRKKEALSLSWRDVICAVKDLKSPSGQTRSSFTLHYIDHKASNKLKAKALTVIDKDGYEDKWINAVNENCQKVSGRPKKAFVVVNPIGGSRRGKKIYQKTVAPLFDMAGIHVTVAFTERSKHGVELSEHQDFSGYDVIVIVGGDGMFQEVLLGLTLQIQNKYGVDYNNPDSQFSKPDIPFGIVPAGTGNGLTGLCNGTIDEVTAALNVIRGETLQTQALTVHSCGKFITICGMCFTYGALADVMKLTDDRRWMGKLRYPYTLAGMLVKKPRMFSCNIEYRMADKPEKLSDDISSGATSNQETEWTVYTGNSGPVCGFMCFLCELIVDGKDIILNPQGKCFDLILDFGCARLDLLKAVYQCANGKNAAGPLPAKLEVFSRITGFRIKVTQDMTENNETISAARAKEIEMEKIFSIDGEVVYVDKPEFDIRLHSNFVSVYGCPKSTDSAKAK